jgi:uncharacterized glyoxalase superfamily protein PhnB
VRTGRFTAACRERKPPAISTCRRRRGGLIIAFVVDDVDAEFRRMRHAGAAVVTPPETEPWGERYCQFLDPNDVVVQLVTWVPAPDAP